MNRQTDHSDIPVHRVSMCKDDTLQRLDIEARIIADGTGGSSSIEDQPSAESWRFATGFLAGLWQIAADRRDGISSGSFRSASHDWLWQLCVLLFRYQAGR